ARREVESYQARAAQLQQEANTLQNALGKLAAEQQTIQAQIDLNEAKKQQLIEDIEATKKKIEQNKLVAGEMINDIDIADKEPLFIQLASSENIAEIMELYENQLSVNKELKRSTDETKVLQKQLEVQMAEVEQILVDQVNQRALIEQKQAEQQRLLDQTKGEEAAYQQLSAEKSAEINALQAAQAAELAARARSYGGGYTSLTGDGSRGGYPTMWASAPMNAYVDNWGMYTRQCVSYTAFKVSQTYGNMPYWGGVGNANQWPGNARAAGIKTSSVPQAGTVGIVSSGTYGHSAWVESVNADGTINISHFNVGWSGEYAEWYNLSPAYFDTYIYFGG
ncbi:hypothetical protein B7Z17_03705, partial [Candidatus Saccharibacteria bacterium 32-49-10]